MREHKPHAASETDVLRKLGYEATDVDAGGLLKWFFYLVIFLFVMSGAAYGVYLLFVPKMPPETATTSLKRQAQILPPAPYPTLQTDPRKDIADFRAAEDLQLKTYGWTDPKHKAVRIPIDAAMDLVAKQGLPVRPGAKPLPIDESAKSGIVPESMDKGPVVNGNVETRPAPQVGAPPTEAMPVTGETPPAIAPTPTTPAAPATTRPAQASKPAIAGGAKPAEPASGSNAVTKPTTAAPKPTAPAPARGAPVPGHPAPPMPAGANPNGPFGKPAPEALPH